MSNSHKRQSFLGPNSEAILREARIAVIGLGGGGSHVVQQLAHVGIGSFVLLDHDSIDETNLNRLIGGTAVDVTEGVKKVDIARRTILAINPDAEVIAESGRWQHHAELLRDADAIVGCVDSFIERDQIEKYARRFIVPYLDIGMDVHAVGDGHSITGQLAVSLPGDLCMRCLGLITEARLAEEAALYGAAGGRPQVVWPNGVLASTLVGALVRMLCPWRERRRRSILIEYDADADELRPSPILGYISQPCAHFASQDDFGDPWFAL